MDELYQSQILALARLARASKTIAHPSHNAHIKNPTCGDTVSLTLDISQDVINHVHVEVAGCALCEAGAGLFLSEAPQKSLTDVQSLHQALERFLKDGQADEYQSLLPLTAIQKVKNRHKCVTLTFDAFVKALAEDINR